MFEATLLSQLKRIFDLDKVTFDKPGESREQECAFVDVSKATTKVLDARQLARVTATLTVFAQVEKLPYGYFTKMIDAAAIADSRCFFFYDLEENKGTYRNISERSVSFVYFFDSQYDPAIGTITEIDLSIQET